MQVINFLLLPVYVEYLSRTDYGILAILAAIEAPVKLFFRWGIDGAFMRYWYDCRDQIERQRLASTLFFFLLTVNGALLVIALAAAPVWANTLFEASGYALALQLTLLNTFAIGFTFIPFHVLRIENRPGEFAALTFARSVATLVLRLVLVIGFGFGVLGIVVTDVAVTAVLIIVMLRWFAALIRPMFSRPVLRQALAFGLPRVPHGLALQVMSVADRFLLKHFGSLADVGTYSIGVTVGLIPKLALGAFEYAWAPFYYATSREAGAQRVFSIVTTYGIALLALMTAGLSAIAADLLALMTGGQYVSAAPVVIGTATGVFFYGIYLLTSIGLNITSHTRYYPISTLIGAALNVGLNLLLIPRFGIVGAAWANATAYAVQALIALGFSQRFYPIRYERARISRVLLSAFLGYALAVILVSGTEPLIGVLVRGALVVVTMGGLLGVTGFFNAEELQWLNQLRRRRPETPVTTSAEATEMAGEIVSVDVPDQVVPPGERRR